MAFCIADAFICLCPHNPHTHWRWTKREWHFIQQNTYSNNNWRIENIIFLVAITHTHTQSQWNVSTKMWLFIFVTSCYCYFCCHFILSSFSALNQLLLLHFIWSPTYCLVSFYVAISSSYSYYCSISLSHTHTNWLEDSFAIFSILFVLLFLDYCSVILAVCGVIARISYNCIALEQNTHFAPTVFFSILVYIVFLLFALCLHTIQHLFSLFLISYPYFVRCLFQFVWAKLHVELAQKNIWKSDGIPKCFLCWFSICNVCIFTITVASRKS